MLIAKQVLQILQQGNQRFISKVNNPEQPHSNNSHYQLVAEQKPIAVVVGCSDSRVPPEIIFDQGIGELFVVRVAGNIITPAQIGSVEFAVQKFDVSLVMVLGHNQCGAVIATLQQLDQTNQNYSLNLSPITEKIYPIVKPLFDAQFADDTETLLSKATHANTVSSAKQLYDHSDILKSLSDDGKLQIVSAEYNIDSGEVVFFGN